MAREAAGMRFDDEDRDALRRLLLWRRDVRHFTGAPLPGGVVDRLRAAMDTAPSVGNARPWRVVQVEDPELRAQVRAQFEAENARAARRYSGARAEAYAALKLAGLDVAPLQLCVFTEADPEAGHGLGRQTLPETLAQSTAMAIFCLWLAARAENIGLGMVSILDPARIEALFEAPPSWRFSAYLCLGCAEFDDDAPLLHRKDWQANTATDWRTR